jgi:hypothetical protein
MSLARSNQGRSRRLPFPADSPLALLFLLDEMQAVEAREWGINLGMAAEDAVQLPKRGVPHVFVRTHAFAQSAAVALQSVSARARSRAVP